MSCDRNSWSGHYVTWLGYGTSTGYPVMVVEMVETEMKAQAHDDPVEIMLKETYVWTACIIGSAK
jgi:hypothetical protein